MRFCGDRDYVEGDMRDIEKKAGVSDRERSAFRREMDHYFANLRARGRDLDYTSEPRLKAAIEALLLTDRRTISRSLSRPRFSRQQVEWERLRSAVHSRLIESYGYCEASADDVISFAVHYLKGGSVLKTPKNEGVEWQWGLDPA